MKKTIGAIAIVSAAILWGIDGTVLTPRLTNHLDTFIIVFLFHAVAFLFMIIPLYLNRKELKKLKWSEWGVFAWIALLGGALGTLAFVKALSLVFFQHLSVIIILQKLQPLFAILLAWFWLKERPNKSFFGYAALALIGSYLITFGIGKPVFSGNSLTAAAILSLFAAFAWGSSTVFGRRAVKLVSFQTATYVRFGLTTMIMLAIVFGMNKFSGFSKITVIDWQIFLIIALTTGGGAIMLYYYGIKNTLASRAAIYELAMPITVVLLDYVINDSIMSLGQFIGAGILLFSMLMITLTGKK